MTSASSGGYTASASSSHPSFPPNHAFDNVDSTFYHTDGTQYVTATGAYQGSNTLNGVNGEWLSLQLPNKIDLSSVHIYPRTSLTSQSADSITIVGSNDGSSWTTLTSVTGLTYTDSTATIINVNSNTGYKYFAIIAQKVLGTNGGTGGGAGHWALTTLELFGLPEYDPEAHGTDVTIKSVPNVPNTDWLEVYYDAKDLADGSTTVNDLKPVGTAVNGTVGGNTTVLDGAFTFDEAGDYIEFTTGKTGNYIFSVSVWFKSSGASIETLFHMNGDYADNNTVWLHGSGTSLYLDFVNNEYSCDTGITIADGNWHHASFVYNGNGQSGRDIYFDGKRLNGVVSGNNAGQNLSLTSTSSTSRIGALNHTSGIIHEFKGSIANFRLYNRALISDEIYQLYAYQKEYFGHGDLSMTLKAGRLGIGTSEPRAMLDVRGNFHSQNMICQTQQYEYYSGLVTVSSGSTTVLTCPFTPKYSNSKILIELSCPVQGSATYFNIFVNRGSSRITSNPGNYGIISYNSGTNLSGHFIHTGIGYDLPGTTSTINYNVVAEYGGGASLQLLTSSGKLLVFIHELCQ